MDQLIIQEINEKKELWKERRIAIYDKATADVNGVFILHPSDSLNEEELNDVLKDITEESDVAIQPLEPDAIYELKNVNTDSFSPQWVLSKTDIDCIAG